MTDPGHASVLRRKTRAAREGGDPRVMSPVRALRLSLARAADTLFGLGLSVATVEHRRIEPADLQAALEGVGLFVLLDGSGGTRGALRLDPALMAGLIEVQTIGQILPGPVRARPATRTDAAMVVPLIDELLAGFDTEMARGMARPAMPGFRYGDRVEDARALTLLLSAPGFDHFRLTVDLGPGARTGRLDLILPPALQPPPPTRGNPTPGSPPPEAAIAEVALSAPVVLDAILARISLPLRAAMALVPGDRVELPGESLGRAQLVAAGGHVVAEGRLGRRDGWRALRLETAASGTGAAPASGQVATGPAGMPPPGTGKALISSDG